MSESVYLSGSEDVRRAGVAIQQAADEMLRAANIMCGAFEQFNRQLEGYVQRIEDVMSKSQNQDGSN